MILALAVAALAWAGPGEGAVAREWRLRRWALEPERHAGELRAAVADERWTARAAGWEALARAARGGVEELHVVDWERALRAALADEHPNVRAWALELLAERPRWVALDGARATSLATDVLPDVRRLLAEVLARQHGPLVVATLQRLAGDPDVRVASAARRALFAQQRSAEPAKLALFTELDPRRERLDYARRLTELALGEPSGVLLRELARRVGDEPGLRALVAALTVRAGARADVDALAAGWLAVGELPPAARALAHEALARLGPAAGRALVERAAAGVEASDARGLYESALAVLAPEEFLTVFAEGSPSLASQVAAWDALAARAAGWEAALVAPWLAPEHAPQLRAAVAAAVLDDLLESGERARGGPVVALLADDDAEFARAAFRALCEAPDPRPWFDDVHAAWRALPADEQLERTRHFTRDHALVPFRADLLELARLRRGERGRLAELLAPFEDSEEVRTALLGFLDQEVGALGLVVTSATPEWRASELRGMGLLRALARFDPERTAPPVARALFAVGDASVDFGKIAAWALGQSSAGRALLPDVLEADLPRRVRIEAASWLARDGDRAAVALLARSYPACEWELKDRILRELGALSDDDSLDFLAAVAADASEPGELRVAAAAALERRGAARAIEEALASRADADVRVALVETLGRAGERERVAALLTPALVALEAGTGCALVGLDEPDDVRAALREAVLVALAEAGAFGPELERAWLRTALARAAPDLEARFATRRLASTSFARRTELFVAARLATAGRLASALEAAGPWWRLDARFLLELAGHASAGGDEDSARRLAGAALVALLGEPKGEARDELAFRAEVELLVLAERREVWSAFARRAERLRRAYRAGAVPWRAWRRAFGELDVQGGVDPAARLASAALQARGLAALERGERHAAERWARAAREHLGGSAEARAAQERLESRLAAARVGAPSEGAAGGGDE